MRIIQTFTVPMSLCFLQGQIQFWQENGYELHILTAASNDLAAVSAKNRVQISPISFQRKIALWQDFKSFWQLAGYFRKVKPQIIHGNTPKAALLTMIAGRFECVPVRIYEMHGLPLETAGFWGKIIWRFIEKISCSCATHVIAVSPSLREVALKDALVSPDKISVMHNGSCNGVDTKNIFNPKNIDSKIVESIRRELKLTKGQSVVGFVGRLNKEKGIKELYEAWQLIKEIEPNVLLLLVGSEDERGQLPKKLLQKIDSDKTILRIGQKANIADYYTLIDFLVLPSYREGLGNVVLEAAAMSKPAIVSDVTGLQDAVIANQTGIFCRPHSAEDLAKKILFYLQNPDLRKRHGIAAQKRVGVDFVPMDIWNSKKALYQHLIASCESLSLRYVPTTLQTTN